MAELPAPHVLLVFTSFFLAHLSASLAPQIKFLPPGQLHVPGVRTALHFPMTVQAALAALLERTLKRMVPRAHAVLLVVPVLLLVLRQLVRASLVHQVLSQA